MAAGACVPGGLAGTVGLLTIAVAAGGRGPVVFLSGEADLTAAGELAAALAAQVDGGARHLTVDLSGLSFADSVSVGALVAASRALRACGGVLVLARPQPTVARTLSLLGVDQVIPVEGQAVTGNDPGSR